MSITPDKAEVRKFWNDASCGENLYLKGESLKDRFNEQLNQRYTLEPEILEFTRFEQYKGKKVLEIGVGLGADHQMWAEQGCDLHGIDLTERAINWTKKRFETFGLTSNLQVGDAENLPFPDADFDVVYSWGVLLYCPDMYRAISEVHRVLKPGGEAIVMLYHKWSFVGYMLWLRYALFRLRPWLSLKYIYSEYLESKGTQAFTVAEVRDFFREFETVVIEINLTHGDLLTSQAGQRHEGVVLKVARMILPRFIIRRFFKHHGLFMKIRAVKKGRSGKNA
jgi:ubiquinone/menaquinone biosynthesis C-methylase UbiE